MVQGVGSVPLEQPSVSQRVNSQGPGAITSEPTAVAHSCFPPDGVSVGPTVTAVHVAQLPRLDLPLY